MTNNKIEIRCRHQPTLTLGNVLHVGRVVEDLGEALQAVACTDILGVLCLLCLLCPIIIIIF